MLWLKILCSEIDLGKCLSIKARKHFPTLVLTFLAVRGIKPGDVSWSILAVIGYWSGFSVGQLIIVATLVEGILVGTFSFFKGFLVGRNFWETLVDGFWDIVRMDRG